MDNYTFSEAVVRGSVRQLNNVPVVGAAVRVFAHPTTRCDNVTAPSGDYTLATTDGNGSFVTRANIGPLSQTTACVRVSVAPPVALSLADTIAAGVVVTMRPNVPGTVFDTATVNVLVRPK